ncbi:unnamed protein product [Protopolystoma xenopodis]|uniref:Uncharacterized protein n=1 Tax=Protopolystoma xenopodis TaxID=117903 RepID=A0A3S5FEJ2_9PLAT|nr:unnamed protein product [Protopolystoma xenopodis]
MSAGGSGPSGRHLKPTFKSWTPAEWAKAAIFVSCPRWHVDRLDDSMSAVSGRLSPCGSVGPPSLGGDFLRLPSPILGRDEAAHGYDAKFNRQPPLSPEAVLSDEALTTDIPPPVHLPTHRGRERGTRRQAPIVSRQDC